MNLDLSPSDWSGIREQFEVMPGVAYLNTGTCGRVPKPVLAAAEEWRRRMAAEPCEILWRRLAESLWPARVALAEFVGAAPQHMIFMANVTAAVNTIASGLRLEPGRDILVTDQEYGAMVYAWQRAAERAGVQVRTVELPRGCAAIRDELIDRFDTALHPRVQLAFFSHVTTATGLILPVQDICRMARERGIRTVVDGAHAPGMIPLALESFGCDFYAGNGHKWLLAPAGSGFLYAAPESGAWIEPLVVSWGWKFDWHRAHERDVEGSTPFIRSHEFQGVRDPAPWLATPAAIAFRTAIGSEAIDRRNRSLAAYARERLSGHCGIEPATPDDVRLSAALASYRLPADCPTDLQSVLWQQFQIEVPVLRRPDGDLLRVSTHFYNTHDEIDRLHIALSGLLR